MIQDIRFLSGTFAPGPAYISHKEAGSFQRLLENSFGGLAVSP